MPKNWNFDLNIYTHIFRCSQNSSLEKKIVFIARSDSSFENFKICKYYILYKIWKIIVIRERRFQWQVQILSERHFRAQCPFLCKLTCWKKKAKTTHNMSMFRVAFGVQFAKDQLAYFFFIHASIQQHKSKLSLYQNIKTHSKTKQSRSAPPIHLGQMSAHHAKRNHKFNYKPLWWR